MISIILPVFNAENYIKKCIESIREQTYGDWELIIIDNGSTDFSYDICREAAKEDGRIEVIHQYQNKGVSLARNLGLERASGEFLTFIDADDWISPDYLEVLYKEQEKENADMVVCSYKIVGQKDREEENDTCENREYSRNLYSLEEYLKQYLLEGNTHCWGVLYRTKKIQDIQFPGKITIGEDLLYLIRAAEKMEHILVLGYQGYQYFINPKGAMLKKYTHEYMDQLICWQQAKEELVASYPQLQDKLDSIIVVSALLITGKISELSAEEKEDYRKDLEECLSIVREKGRKSSVRRHLPKGYPFKVFLFAAAPSLYLSLYGAKKSMEKAAE